MRILVFDDAECVRVRVRVCVCGDAFSRMKKMIDELFFCFSALDGGSRGCDLFSLWSVFSLSLSLSLCSPALQSRGLIFSRVGRKAGRRKGRSLHEGKKISLSLFSTLVLSRPRTCQHQQKKRKTPRFHQHQHTHHHLLLPKRMMRRHRCALAPD